MIAKEWTLLPTTDRRLLVAAGSMAAAALGASALWGFTVDDALISARVAHHLAVGSGYRFNPSGPVTDAVTPLGWAYVLAPFAKAGPLAALAAARWLGVACWLLASGLLGWWVSGEGMTARRLVPLSLLGLSFPLAAWSVAGMETAIVMSLGVIALGRGRPAPLAAGLAAAWRPELIPWALVLNVGGAVAMERPQRGRLLAAAAALGPALVVATIRYAAFARPAPLAALAKPSDTAHGLFYVGVALLWSGAPAACLAARTWRHVDGHTRIVALAVAAHLLAMLGAGGDWMPYARLFAPALPGLVLVATRLAPHVRPAGLAARWLLALLPTGLLVAQQLPAARGVYASRLELIEGLRPLLPGGGRVATVDVGWVGAASSGDVVDLAGVTDPDVALLPGSHTDKHIPRGFLERRRVDVLVLLLAQGADATHPRFARAVEKRIIRGIDDLEATPLGTLETSRAAGPRYLVLRLNEFK